MTHFPSLIENRLYTVCLSTAFINTETTHNKYLLGIITHGIYHGQSTNGTYAIWPVFETVLLNFHTTPDIKRGFNHSCIIQACERTGK